MDITKELEGARLAPPNSSAMIESLRGLGYSTESALADLIDNSITAGASRVDVSFNWEGRQSWVTLSDNGSGMSADGLVHAMTLGDKSPETVRSKGDLGRFGLGLKTASFSQARRLTVATRSAGQVSSLRWDLDVLANAADGAWYLLQGAHPASKDRLDKALPVETGTVVLWETMDRIVTSGFNQKDFLDLIDRVERHLAMVFHRYLDRSGVDIEIIINGRPLRPWDPFLETHTSTWKSPKAAIGSNRSSSARAFVLPHKDRLTAKEFDGAAGPDGWAAQQGFYVYRGRRLLVAGSWLGLGRGRLWTKDEAHRLARIRLDITNSEDADWKIDIRKSSATPPVWLKDQLTRLAEDARDRARKVYAYRASPASGRSGVGEVEAVWVSEDRRSGRVYRINRSHPAVLNAFSKYEVSHRELEAMLRVVEETVPVQRIWLEAAETGEHGSGAFGSVEEPAIRAVIEPILRNMVDAKAMELDDAVEQLKRTEPFDLHVALLEKIASEFKGITKC